MLNAPANYPAARGFSLVELMIGMAAGLILVGSVIGLVVSNLQNNAVTVRGMRLTQESRALVEMITRELRRARYNGNSMAQIGTGATLSTFNTLALANSGTCVKYAYDADDNGVAGTGEFRMFSRVVVSGRGLVRYGRFDTAGAISCSGGSIISSDDINITGLTFTSATSKIDFTLSLSMAADATSVRQTSSTVMLRSGTF